MVCSVLLFQIHQHTLLFVFLVSTTLVMCTVCSVEVAFFVAASMKLV